MRNRPLVWSKPKKAARRPSADGRPPREAGARAACAAEEPPQVAPGAREVPRLQGGQVRDPPGRGRSLAAARGTAGPRTRGAPDAAGGPDQRDPSTARRQRRRCAQDDKGRGRSLAAARGTAGPRPRGAPAAAGGPDQRDPSTARRLRRRCAQDDKGLDGVPQRLAAPIGSAVCAANGGTPSTPSPSCSSGCCCRSTWRSRATGARSRGSGAGRGARPSL